MNLEELRTEIDAIDDTLVNAFAQRMDVVARVSQAKKEQGLPTLDPARERAKLADIASKLPPELAQKYMEHFKQPEQFINLNGQIIALPVEPENPLRTAEMTVEDDYGMIDGVLNNGRRGEELEKAQGEARRTTPEKKPSIRERLEDAKRECAERKSPDKPALQKKPPELGDL